MRLRHGKPTITLTASRNLREVRAGIFCGPSGSGPGRRAWLRAAWPAPWSAATGPDRRYP